jgi:hypothetical protein
MSKKEMNSQMLELIGKNNLSILNKIKSDNKLMAYYSSDLNEHHDVFMRIKEMNLTGELYFDIGERVPVLNHIFETLLVDDFAKNKVERVGSFRLGNIERELYATIIEVKKDVVIDIRQLGISLSGNRTSTGEVRMRNKVQTTVLKMNEKKNEWSFSDQSIHAVRSQIEYLCVTKVPTVNMISGVLYDDRFHMRWVLPVHRRTWYKNRIDAIMNVSIDKKYTNRESICLAAMIKDRIAKNGWEGRYRIEKFTEYFYATFIEYWRKYSSPCIVRPIRLFILWLSVFSFQLNRCASMEFGCIELLHILEKWIIEGIDNLCFVKCVLDLKEQIFYTYPIENPATDIDFSNERFHLATSLIVAPPGSIDFGKDLSRYHKDFNNKLVDGKNVTLTEEGGKRYGIYLFNIMYDNVYIVIKIEMKGLNISDDQIKSMKDKTFILGCICRVLYELVCTIRQCRFMKFTKMSEGSYNAFELFLKYAQKIAKMGTQINNDKVVVHIVNYVFRGIIDYRFIDWVDGEDGDMICKTFEKIMTINPLPRDKQFCSRLMKLLAE